MSNLLTPSCPMRQPRRPRGNLSVTATTRGLVGIIFLLATAPMSPGEQPDRPTIDREILIPFEDLQPILDKQRGHILLSRAEYEALLAAARTAEGPEHAPDPAIFTSADYSASIVGDRAEIIGRLTVELFEPGVHAVALDVGNVGILRATLDDHGAPLAQAETGQLTLFVEGEGRHSLELHLTAPVRATVTDQTLSLRIPVPPVMRMSLSVRGDVELRSGAGVLSRRYDEATQLTSFELLPLPRTSPASANVASSALHERSAHGEDTITLVLSRNSHFSQAQRAVLSRAVLVDEVCAAYERLHATFSMTVLHQPVDGFRFAVPDGFEVTDVQSPQLASWAVRTDGARHVLSVALREPSIGRIVLGMSALRVSPGVESWKIPRLEPLDVVGQAAVVGLLLEDQLALQSISSTKLIPIDVNVITDALPASVSSAVAGAPRLRAVAAYYAPSGSGDFDAAALLDRPAGRLFATTNVLYSTNERGIHARAVCSLQPQRDTLYSADVLVPNGWHVSSVTDGAAAELAYEAISGRTEGGETRVHIVLGTKVSPGSRQDVILEAAHTPPGWLSHWMSKSVPLPVIRVANAERELGAVAIRGTDEMTIYADETRGLIPLDDRDRADFGLNELDESRRAAAFRYDRQPYRATLRIERTPPRLTARTYSFFHLAPTLMECHAELVFDADRASVTMAQFSLPADSPAELTIRGLEGATVKESESEIHGDRRIWTVHLAEPHRGAFRLTVNFEHAWTTTPLTDVSLPLIRVEGVTHQSGVVAVEGSAELNVEVVTHPRRVDIGELAGALHRPTQAVAGGLGAFAFIGDDPSVIVRLRPYATYGLPTAVVQRCELVTQLSESGVAQTAARLALRSRASFLEIELPAHAELWAVRVDDRPMQPQRDGDRLVLSIPAVDRLLDLQIVFACPVESVSFWGDVPLSSPRLFVRGEQSSKREELLTADLVWHLHLPPAFQLVNVDGTVRSGAVASATPAAWLLPDYLWTLSGGINPLYGSCLPSLSRARELSVRSTAQMKADSGSRRGGLFDAVNQDLANAEREAGGESLEPQQQMQLPPPPAPARHMKHMEANGGIAAEKPSPGGQSVGKASSRSDAYWALEGVRSLQVDLERPGRAFTFQSLGTDPRIRLTLANAQRLELLGRGLALATFLAGVVLMRRSLRVRTQYVLLVLIAATLVPLLSSGTGLYQVANPVFNAACLLAAFFVAFRAARAVASFARRTISRRILATSVVAIVSLVVTPGAMAEPQPTRGTPGDPLAVTIVDPKPPIVIPDDAVIVPYDASGVPNAWPPQPSNQVLISYTAFQRLSALAHRISQAAIRTPATSFAWLGGQYATSLGEEHSIELSGHLEVMIFVDEVVSLPLSIADGVLSSIQVDGQPANIANGPDQPPPSKETPTPPRGFLVQVKGRGRHTIDLSVRLPVGRDSGWRTVNGQVPSVPGTSLNVNLSQPDTEVRLNGMDHTTSGETTTPTERLTVALSPSGLIQLKWRQRVSESAVDASLTAAANVLMDLREDGVHVIWKLTLDAGRSRPSEFQLVLPAAFAVQSIDGPNVRGWTVTSDDANEATVSLLSPSDGKEAITVVLHQPRRLISPEPEAADCPVVSVRNAALQNGIITIRRSSRLDVSTDSTAGVARINVPGYVKELLALDSTGAESPLGMTDYQAYRFASLPFSIRLRSVASAPRLRSNLEAVLRISDWKRTIEARINLGATGLPLHQVRLAIPDDLAVESVRAPGAFEWSVLEGTPRTVHIQLAEGQEESISVILRGTLGQEGSVESVRLPRILVDGVASQSGDFAVQVDPAFDLIVETTAKCTEVPVSRADQWLDPAQRPLTRTIVRTHGTSYDATLTLRPRTPEISVTTITNIRVTESTVEETILLDYDITQAGVHSLTFSLPRGWHDARITAPMLRTRFIEPAAEDPNGPVRVRLLFQGEIMGRVRVLAAQDRSLTGDTIAVPRPVVETGDARRVFASFESAGRDEVVVETSAGFERVVPGQREWAQLTELVGSQLTQAYVATQSDPVLTLNLHERVAVETTGARIGLARTELVADASGAYRATQYYRVENRSEQFLDVDLPAGADLWVVEVAGHPVKPARPAGATGGRRVRIPMIKTAAGDLDFEVVLRYGGVLPALGGLRQVDFPMPRAVNIPVELSQASLYLPSEFRWMNFGGTMGLVDDGAELAAGYVRYQTRQTERLGEALADQNPFAQARAASNLREVKSEIDKLRGRAAGGAQSLATELDSNDAAFGRVQLQQQQVERQIVAPSAMDNRSRLLSSFQSQKVDSARNALESAASNFDDSAAAPSGTKAGASFDKRWLEGEGGRNAAGQAGDRKGHARVQTTDERARNQSRSNAPTQTPQAFKDSLSVLQSSDKTEEAAKPQSPRSQRAELGDLARQYHQQLGKSVREDREDDASPAVERMAGSIGGVGGELGAGRSAAFPLRGIAFRFTTPRGDQTITARAISRGFIERLVRLAMLLIASAIASLVLWLLSRHGAVALLGRHFARVMIILGAISVLGGILPGGGILAILTGLAIRPRPQPQQQPTS